MAGPFDSDSWPEGKDDPLADEAVAPEPETTQEEAPPEAEPEPEPEPTPEIDWKKRYDDIRVLQQNTAAEREQLRQAVERLAAYVQSPAAAAPPQPSEEDLVKAGLDPEQYKALEPLIQQQMDQRLAAMQQQIEYQRQQEAQQSYAATVADTITGFFTRHPEVEKGSPMDDEVGNAVRYLAGAWSDKGYEFEGAPPESFFLTTSEGIDIAYEAAQRPMLRDILAMNPEYADSEAGMDQARRLATLMEATKPTTQTPPATRSTPHVEHGGSKGGPPSPSQVVDEFAEVEELAKKDKANIFR